LISAVDLAQKRKEQRNKMDYRGEVVAVNPNGALIRVGGSQTTQQAAVLGEIKIEVGDLVLIQKNMINPRVHWVIIGSMGKRDYGVQGVAERPYRELFPPSNVRQVNVVPNVITIMWDAPPTDPVLFEVQHSPDGTDENAEEVLFTRGSVAFLVPDEIGVTITSVRVRSYAPDGQYSAWSPWLSDVTISIATVSDNTIAIYFDTWADVYPILTTASGLIVTSVSVTIEEAFDQPVDLSVGEAGSPTRFFSPSEILPGSIGTYLTNPMIPYFGAEDLQLLVGANSATTGLGYVIVEF
jgi:hypothetical protein